jgi:5-methylcytosine-specific restriction enzyme subunit McrC
MYRLYERFVLAYYRRHFPDLNASGAHIEWATDDGVTQLLPAMKSDITLRHQGKTLIIDTKCYSEALQNNSFFNSRTLHSQHLYQIFAYVKNHALRSADEVSGLLLYAKTDEEILPHHDYRMSGNRISVRTLDLSRTFREISEQLNDIVQQFLYH